MANQKSFSCFVIGSDALLIECAEILLRQGHDVRGVISSTPRVLDWALGRGLATFDPRAGYADVLAREPFDYLFAITHLDIIPDEVLALPTRGAINFHDGPLPRYAGLNAPAWAIMAGENAYGITWHWIGPKIDAGDILSQVTFDVASDETSLSLNTKCFAQAIESFGDLVNGLAEGTAVATPQVLSERSYFGRFRRPEAACVIDWTRSAASIDALVRALDFGERYSNALGLPKVRVGAKTFVITRAEVESSSEPLPRPGTVISVRPDAIEIATGDGALAIQGATNLVGEFVEAAKLAKQLGLEVGTRFENLTQADRERLTELDKSLCRAERFWVDRLQRFDPVETPYAAAEPSAGPRAHADVPLELAAWGSGSGHEVAPLDALAAALMIVCARIVPRDSGSIGLVEGALARELDEAAVWFAETVPFSMQIDWGANFQTHRDRAASELAEVRSHRTYLRDVVARYPELRQNGGFVDGSAWPVCICVDAEPPSWHTLALVVPSSGNPRLSYDTRVLSDDDARAIARHLTLLISSAARTPDANVGALPLSTDEERARVLVDPNRTDRSYAPTCVHRLVEAQVARTPDQTALVFEDSVLSYRELNERSNRLAAHLRSLGVGPDVLVGIHLERSLDLVIAVLATLKAGGAYVPLDPSYPEDRVSFMVDDAKLAVVVTNEKGPSAPRAERDVAVVRLDVDAEKIAAGPEGDAADVCGPENLAYVIYTSGSTGRPKGVMVEHRNVANFFGAMDDRIPHDPPGTWLAVTSLSFDISVLELLWPLTRGFRVVIHRDRGREAAGSTRRRSRAPMDFSLFYFASDESAESQDKYQLLLEGAKFADKRGFVAVWTPERHFHAFGGLYPNPAVTGAALAVLTEKIQIRAGSVVLPLHHPARVAEAWSVVDNLSHGRVGISFASGWQPNDFVLQPANFKDSKAIMFRDLEVVKALWRGESVSFPGPKGDTVPIRTLPRPVQKELPIWITTAGNVETYKAAGRIGANILTHLLGQSVSELGPKIRAYRDARRENGHDPNAGVVSLMLHTFVGDDDDEVREIVREPLKRYLGSSLELLKHYAWAFPAFSRPKDVANDAGDDLARLSDEERDALLEHAYLRYYETSGLFGRPEDCIRRIDELAEIGVNEVACLIDFGVPTSLALSHLAELDRLRSMVAEETGQESDDPSIGAAIRRHQVTHLQCTPSMARMLLDDPSTRPRLDELRCWLLGGEALSSELVRDIRSSTSAALFNMYGPTETTVWSTMHTIGDGPRVSIGRPLANTRVYVLDPRGQPVPTGACGEVFIGGDGVARGYLGREELTAERFVRDPFSTGRMYRTGDLARWANDGTLEFVGRTDQQIKIRGHRVELGEIEAVIGRQAGVRQCAVVLREDEPGDQRLVAYVMGAVDGATLGETLRARLPAFMVPAHVVLLARLPETPNRKIDRRALPRPEAGEVLRRADYVAPENDTERTIAKLWQEILGRERIGTEDNFFDVGGHSLLVVRMHRRLRDLLTQPVTLTDLYRFPTIRSLTEFLTRSASQPSHDGASRADRRREMIERRRRSSHV